METYQKIEYDKRMTIAGSSISNKLESVIRAKEMLFDISNNQIVSYSLPSEERVASESSIGAASGHLPRRRARICEIIALNRRHLGQLEPTTLDHPHVHNIDNFVHLIDHM